MTGLPDPDGRAAIDAALAAPVRVAHALGSQRGRLRLVGELATVYPRLVVAGHGAALAVGRALVAAARAAGGDAVALPTSEILLHPTHVDGRTLLLVVASGDDARAHRLVTEAAALPARPLIAVAVDAAGTALADAADVSFTSDVDPDTGPPLAGPLASAVLLSAIARMLTWGASAEIDDVLALTADAATAVERAGRSLADLPAERLTILTSLLGGRAGLLVTGRDGGRAAAELAALAWWTNAGRAVAVCDAADLAEGPIEAAGRDLSVLVLSPDSAANAADRDVAAEFARAGSAVVFVGPRSSAPHGVEAVVLPEIDPVVDPVVAALVATIVGRRVAADRGRPVGRRVHAPR